MSTAAEGLSSFLSSIDVIRRWHEARALAGKPRRPLIVDLSGTPRSGKTSCVQALQLFLKHAWRHSASPTSRSPSGRPDDFRYRVLQVHEAFGEREASLLGAHYIDLNLWAGARAMQEILLAWHDREHDVVLLDRGLWDAGCWFQYWVSADGAASPEDAMSEAVGLDMSISPSTFLEHPLTLRPDLHVVLTVDQVEARRRDQATRPLGLGGLASHADVMTGVDRIVRREFDALLERKCRSRPSVGALGGLLLDTTTLERDSLLEKVLASLWAVARCPSG